MDAMIDLSNTILETRRLILRPFCQEDLMDLYAYASIPGVGEMAGWKHHQSIEESQIILDMFIREKKTLAVVFKFNQKVIGSIGLEKTSEELDESYKLRLGRDIGYVLAKDYWGQGLMVEGVKKVIEHAFNVLNLDFITCGYFIHNHRSQSVNRKCGFRFLKEIKFETQQNTIEITNLTVLDNPHYE